MPFADQLDNLNQLRAAVMIYSPKDEKGRLNQPYNRWLTQIDKDILLAIQYLKKAGIEYKPATPIEVKTPSDLQESDLSPEDDGE